MTAIRHQTGSVRVSHRLAMNVRLGLLSNTAQLGGWTENKRTLSALRLSVAARKATLEICTVQGPLYVASSWRARSQWCSVHPSLGRWAWRSSGPGNLSLFLTTIILWNWDALYVHFAVRKLKTRRCYMCYWFSRKHRLCGGRQITWIWKTFQLLLPTLKLFPGLYSPRGLQEIEASRIFYRQMKVVRLSALHSGRLCPQEICLLLIYVRGSVDTRAIVRPEGWSQ